MSLSIKKTGTADFTVSDEQEQIAEIRGLTLSFARFRPGGKPLIGDTVPLFLFWMQYANHQDPERNAGTGGTVEIITESSDQVVLKCSGITSSGNVECCSARCVELGGCSLQKG